MSDYTAVEVEAAIEAADLTWDDLSCGSETFKLRGESVETESVADWGGEDEGSNRGFVFKIGDQLFRKDGYYASHYGTEWDGEFREVHEATKTVTVYE